MFFLELKNRRNHRISLLRISRPPISSKNWRYGGVHKGPFGSSSPTNLENCRFTTSDSILYSKCWYLLLNGINRGCRRHVAENITLDTLFSRSRGVPLIREQRMQLEMFWLSQINKGLSWVQLFYQLAYYLANVYEQL